MTLLEVGNRGARLRTVSWYPMLVALGLLGCAGAKGAQTEPNIPSQGKPGYRTSRTSLEALTVAEVSSWKAPAGTLGTPGPALLVAASPNMAWTVLCQAREDTDGNGALQTELSADGDWKGDSFHPYLVRGHGVGEKIDEYVGSSPRGRYIAFIQTGQLWLEDTELGKRHNLSQLGADPRNDQSSFLPHRAVTFDPQGEYAAYIRKQGPRTWVVLRNLETDEETPVDPGASTLWRLEFSQSGHFLQLLATHEDTNGNGRIGWRVPPADAGSHACPSPLPHFSVRRFPGDKPVSTLYHLETGESLRVPRLVATVGNSYITRNSAGELWQREIGGKRRKVSSEDCQGKILHLDDKSGTVLFGCTKSYGDRRTMFVRTATARKGLHFTLIGFEEDGRLPGQPDWVVLNPQEMAVLVELASGKQTPITSKTRWLATYKQNLLVERNDKLYWLSSDAQEQPVGLTRPELGELKRAGPYVALGETLLNLETRAVVGRFTLPPLLVSPSGRSLVSSGYAGWLPQAPLHWEAAK